MHPSNILDPIDDNCIPGSNTILSNADKPENALFLIDLTEFGTVILVIELIDDSFSVNLSSLPIVVI
jgi:hypothetical protein